MTNQEWEKKFDEKVSGYEEQIRNELFTVPDWEFIKSFISTQISLAEQRGADEERLRLVNEIIALSDKIESEYETEFNEWRAFKGLRNELRDKYIK